MPRNAFSRIMAEYAQAREEPFAGHPLAEFIRRDLPDLFSQRLPKYPQIIWKASPGQGRWADAPWLAAFDPIVTETAQREYYPVFLFTRSLDRVYLSLNQGMTLLRKEFGDEDTREVLRHRARILRNRLDGQFEERFPVSDLDLQATGPHTRLAMYEPGHAFGTVYQQNIVPPANQIIADSGRIVELYLLVTARGGTSEFDIGQPQPDPIQPDLENMTLEEARTYRYHRKFDRNARLAREAKRIHGYVCQVCGFNFEESYGNLGSEYIEAHHLVPLAELPEGQVVPLSPHDDFTVVCANCHRMIHRRGSPATFEEFVQSYGR